jgi:hypothetical protein
MACCEGKRAAMRVAASRPVIFEYRGKTSLTAVGAATRRLYWFGAPGARVKVHARDAESLAGAPHLTEVKP